MSEIGSEALKQQIIDNASKVPESSRRLLQTQLQIINEIPKIPQYTTCEISSSDSDNELAKLQSCRDAMVCYSNLMDYNQKIAEYNRNQDKLLQVAHEEWSKKKQDYLTKQSQWLTKYNTEDSRLKNERTEGSCNPGGVCVDRCPSNFENDGTRRTFTYNCKIAGLKTGCRARCRRTARSIEEQIALWLKNNPKPIFTLKEPGRVDFPHLQQNTTNINMNCCSNYINIDGDASDNVQSCIQKIDQTRIDIIKREAGSDQPSDQPSDVPYNVPSDEGVIVHPEYVHSEKIDIVYSAESEEILTNQMIFIIVGIIIAILLILCFLSSSSIIISRLD